MCYIDFGASAHVFHKRIWFKNYESISSIKIYMGNNSTQKAIGRRDIKVSMHY
jgi:hypothetical protein